MDSAVKQRCDLFINNCFYYPERLRVFAQGDSWLALPGGLWDGMSVVEHLNSKSWVASKDGGAPLNVLSVALPGKTLENMAGDSNLHYALTYLQLRSQQTGVPYGFDAIMVSGGGNDFLQNPRALIAGDGNGDGHVRVDMVTAGIERVKAAWQNLFNVLAPWNVPILSHGYGPIIPTTKASPIRIPFKTIGPWVGPYLLTELGIPPLRARALVAEALDYFNTALQGIAGLTYFDVRAVVAAVAATDWHDEIHFLEPGWDALSSAWLTALRQVAAQPRKTSTAKVAYLTTRTMHNTLAPDLAKAMATTPPAIAATMRKKKSPAKKARPLAKSAARRTLRSRRKNN
jgi:hypothetical protein